MMRTDLSITGRLHVQRAMQRSHCFITERKLFLHGGAEGPHHDPYGWSEYCVRVNGSEVALRFGALGYARLLVDGVQVLEEFEQCIVKKNQPPQRWRTHELFESITGIAVRDFEEHYYRAHPYYEDPYGPASRYE